MDIAGNQLVNQADKAVALKLVVDVRIAFDEVIKSLRKLVLEEWQGLWSSVVENKIKVIKRDARL